MSDDAFALRPPVPAEPFLPGSAWPWWAWALATLAAAALLGLALALLRARRKRPTPHDLAALRRRAHVALAAIDPTAPPATVATAVSLALRRFLADALDDPALFETHEEFLTRPHPLRRLPDDQRAATNHHFATLARMKYAPQDPTDPLTLITEARSLLDQLHPLPPPLPHHPPHHLFPDNR